MYIWVVLATFIVALHCFNLSVRQDMRAIYVEPQAESSITKMIMQHRAARQYLTYEIANGANQYPKGEIELSNLDDFLPTGFELKYEAVDESGNVDEDAEVPPSQRYISRVYCLDGTTLSTGLSKSIADCRDENAVNYLITYGCVPQKWKRLDANRPANDLLNAIRRVAGSGSNFGYSIEVDVDGISAEEMEKFNPLKTTMRISNWEQTWMSIPQYIISGDVGESGFSKVCGDDRECGYCLVYMDTLGKK